MAKYIANNNPNPFVIAQPYFVPNYTGHVQGYSEVLGRSLGRHSFIRIKEKPETGGPLSPCAKHQHPQGIICDPQKMLEEDIEILNAREPQDLYFLDHTDAFVHGYTGYIPRTPFMAGDSYNKSCIKGIAEMERLYKREQDFFKQKRLENQRM